MPSARSCITSVNCVMVDKPWRKPCWLLDRMPSCSRKTVKCYRMICSSSLHAVLVSDIGLKFVSMDLSPNLCIGIIFAIFQSSGSLDVERDFRKIIPRYLLHHCAYRLKN